ncbi:hypothetical protein V2V90_23805 (plasmid) [Agrobacterium leguminum]|uniref:hypothetical protein n=1 Tax=Agrobacterium leguminum TaxID=2792015 RepID=UPI0030D3F49F
MTDDEKNKAIDIIREDAPQVARLERFYSLEAGQYWRAQRDIPEEGITAGTVLLIKSIRWVDDAAHTIILRSHPSVHGKSAYVEIPQEDGSARRSWIKFEEHRFLLDNFLTAFEFEPDFERVRGEEINQARSKIDALQMELLEAQQDPAILAAVVDTAMEEQARKDAAKAEGDGQPAPSLPVHTSAASRDLAGMAQASLADALQSGITPERIETLRAAASREHQVATIKANWIKDKTSGISEAVAALTPFYEEKAAAALARTEDVRTYVAKMLRGIETLDLYVGKDVEVETIREGVAAPRDIPLTFVQKKLLMDEELAVFTDVDEWFDFSKVDLFFDALRTHDELVNQIFPTERCVLVMATTRRHIDYGDKWTNHVRNEANREVFLLVRNGWNIHRVFSPVESHLGASRLFPSQDDQKRPFRGFDGSEIKFDDVAYTDRLAAYEMQALHYKRFLVLACGLDHRSKLFGDFYDGPPTFDFVSIAFQDRYCRFLHDDDGAGFLPGEDRPDVFTWIKSRNAYLRSGSRVLCNWRSLMDPTTAPSACFAYRRDTGFDRRYEPAENISLAIAYREAQSICVDVAVSGYSYSRRGDGNRTFNCKVNLTKAPGSRWGHTEEAYLCLDAVKPEELHWYIHNRGARRDHIAYIRFFKHALKHVQAERAAEADTRRRLRQALADGRVATGEDAEAIIDQAVVAWRAANRGKPLPAFDGETPPDSWKSLLDQMYMLAGEGARMVEDIATFARDIGLAPLRLILSGEAKTVLYAAPSPDECDDRLEPYAWVHRITVERGKTKMLEKARRWARLPRLAVSETTLHEWEAAAEWSQRHSDFSSPDHKARVLATAGGFAETLRPISGRLSEGEHAMLLMDWTAVRDEMTDGARYVQNPSIAVPFGIVRDRDWRELRYLCIASSNAHVILYRLAPSETARENVRKAFVSIYQNKSAARERFARDVSDETRWSDWSLATMSMTGKETRFGIYVDGELGYLYDDRSGDPLLGPSVREWLALDKAEDTKRRQFWLPDDLFGKDGSFVPDDLLGNKRPDDYERTVVLVMTVTHSERPDEKTLFADMRPAEAADKNSRNLVSLRKGENDPHVAGFSASGWSSTSQQFVSPSHARSYIERCAVERGLVAVPAHELPEMPPAPEGMSRWYMIAKPE